MYFVDEGFDIKRLWESVEGYIGSVYDLEALETIYLHVDGGSWIVNVLQSLCSTSDEGETKNLSEFGTYLMEHWEAIRMRVGEELLGGCTEGQVSYILSERFSRNPLGWRRDGLGRMSKQRVQLKNNGKIKAADFKGKREPETDTDTYKEYARQLLSKTCEKKMDWSLFDKREPNKTSMIRNTRLS